MVRTHYESMCGSSMQWHDDHFYWLDIFAVNQNFKGDFKVCAVSAVCIDVKGRCFVTIVIPLTPVDITFAESP